MNKYRGEMIFFTITKKNDYFTEGFILHFGKFFAYNI